METRSIPLESDRDVLFARNSIRQIASDMGFRSIDQTRLATLTSELARNIIKYAGRGRIITQTVESIRSNGLKLVFEDNGPGIADVANAMRDGFSTGGGLGKGLPGSRRLADEFAIDSVVGRGTRVTVVKWK